MKTLIRLQAFNKKLESSIHHSHHHSGAVASNDAARRTSAPGVVVLVMDHSGSMGWADYPPSRLGAAKDAAEEYVTTLARQSPNTYVAVVGFGHEAQLVCELTSIRHHKRIIRSLRDICVQGGTDIAVGLKLAVKVIENPPVKNAMVQLILLTDGHGGHPVSISQKAKQRHNATIDVVGIGGTPEDVNECLLRTVATTDPDGRSHYRFVKDAHTLKQHYHQLAKSLTREG